MVIENTGVTIQEYIDTHINQYNSQFTKKIIISILYFLKKIKQIGLIMTNIDWSNIFICKNSGVKFISLEDMIFLNEKPRRVFNNSAPEIHFNSKVDFQSDMWQIGCLLYKLVTKKDLFSFENISENLSKALLINKSNNYFIFKDDSNYSNLIIGNGCCYSKVNQKDIDILVTIPKKNVDPLSELSSLENGHLIIDFIRRCIQVDPYHRLSVDNAIQHPFILSK